MLLTLIYITKILHLAILVFIVFGWISSNQFFLIIHIISVPLVILQWKLNKGNCLLTDFEASLKRKKYIEITNSEVGFVKNILKLFLKDLPSDKQIMFLMYGIMTLSLSISIFKYFLLF